MVSDLEQFNKKLKEYGINYQMIAELVGVTPCAIRHQLVGRRKLTQATIVAADELIKRRPLYLLAAANKLIEEACRLAKLEGRDIVAEFAATDLGHEIIGSTND